MTYTRMHNRLGTTAIAAVLALSSTALAAQEVPSAETPLAEVTTTVPEPAAPTVDPLAPVAEPEVTPTPAETTASAEPGATSAPEPVAKKTAAKTVRTTKFAATKTAASAKPVAAPVPAPADEAPLDATPVPIAATMPTPEAVAAPVAQPAEEAQLKEALPIAGGAGALILALAGAGMAVRRKRRNEDQELEHNRLEDDELVLADEADSEPKQSSWDPPVRAPQTPMPAAMEATGVSDDFDTSKFGRHVQAAYGGPTPENPSLSLRKRLKIAGELDRRERLGLTHKPVEAVNHATTQTSEKMAISFGDTATKARVHEYQF